MSDKRRQVATLKAKQITAQKKRRRRTDPGVKVSTNDMPSTPTRSGLTSPLSPVLSPTAYNSNKMYVQF